MLTEAPRIKVVKQSLIDWQVTDEAGKPVAWITRGKDRIGYDVTCYANVGDSLTFFETSFSSARECARRWLALDNQPEKFS